MYILELRYVHLQPSNYAIYRQTLDSVISDTVCELFSAWAVFWLSWPTGNQVILQIGTFYRMVGLSLGQCRIACTLLEICTTHDNWRCNWDSLCDNFWSRQLM